MKSCTIRSALLKHYQEVGHLYSVAVKELSQNIGVCAKDRYDEFYTRSEIARAEAIQAREDLDGHIQEHGCGVE